MKQFSLLTAIIISLAFLAACGSAPTGTDQAPNPDPDVTPVPDPDPEPEPEEELAITIIAAQTSADQGELVDLSVEAEGPENIQVEWAVTAGSLIDVDGFFTDSGDDVQLVTPHKEQTVTVTVTATAGSQTDTDAIAISVTVDEAEFCADFGAVPTDPCVIYTVEQLQMLADDDFLAGHFALGADIDATQTAAWNNGEGFEPIGVDGNPFIGALNGDNYTISGLFISRPNDSNIGLFGYTTDSAISNLKLHDIEISGRESVGGVVGKYVTTSFIEIEVSGKIFGHLNHVGGIGGSSNQNDGPERLGLHVSAEIEGREYVGGLFGQLQYSTVTGSSFDGEITGENYIGGIVGKNNQGIIQESYSKGAINGDSYVGGLVGQNTNAGKITQSFTSGEVSGGQNVGGLVGLHGHGNITNAYSMSNVTGHDKVGGLVGSYTAPTQTIENTYSVGHVHVTGPGAGLGQNGLIGSTNGSIVTDSYWDTEVSGQSSSAADATPRTTAEMAVEANFENWDFDNTWTMPDGFEAPDLINNSRF